MSAKKAKISPERLGLYRKIEIARDQLQEMDDDTYFRDWLEQHYGKRSRTDLSVPQLVRVVNDFASMGAVFTSGGTNKKIKPHVRPDWMEIPENTPNAPMKRQICQIWRKLGYSMTSLETRVKREFGTHTLLWLHDEKKLSALLTDLQKREKAFDKKRAASEGNS